MTQPPVDGTAKAEAVPGDLLDAGARARWLKLGQPERYGTLAFFGVFYAIVGVLKGGVYLSVDNLLLVLGQNAYVAFAAVAVTVTLIAGQFDLSVGALVGLSAVVVSVLTALHGMPVLPAVLITLALGVAAGLVNGILVTMFQINAFIATLATSSAMGGIALLATNNNVVYENLPQSLLDAGQTDIGRVPIPAIYIAVLLVVAWVLTIPASGLIAAFFWYVGRGFL